MKNWLAVEPGRDRAHSNWYEEAVFSEERTDVVTGTYRDAVVLVDTPRFFAYQLKTGELTMWLHGSLLR